VPSQRKRLSSRRAKGDVREAEIKPARERLHARGKILLARQERDRARGLGMRAPELQTGGDLAPANTKSGWSP
jgi:hypothetical protein